MDPDVPPAESGRGAAAPSSGQHPPSASSAPSGTPGLGRRPESPPCGWVGKRCVLPPPPPRLPLAVSEPDEQNSPCLVPAEGSTRSPSSQGLPENQNILLRRRIFAPDSAPHRHEAACGVGSSESKHFIQILISTVTFLLATMDHNQPATLESSSKHIIQPSVPLATMDCNQPATLESTSKCIIQPSVPQPKKNLQKGQPMALGASLRAYLLQTCCLLSHIPPTKLLAGFSVFEILRLEVTGYPICLLMSGLAQASPMRITEIGIGVLEIVFGVLLAVTAEKYDPHYGAEHILNPYWLGILYIISGSLSVAVAKKPERLLVKFTLGMHVVSFAAAGVAISLLSFSVMHKGNFQRCGYYYMDYPPGKCEEVLRIPYAQMLGMSIILLVFSILEFLITITAAAFGCATLCRKASSKTGAASRTQTVVIFQNTIQVTPPAVLAPIKEQLHEHPLLPSSQPTTAGYSSVEEG